MFILTVRFKVWISLNVTVIADRSDKLYVVDHALEIFQDERGIPYESLRPCLIEYLE